MKTWTVVIEIIDDSKQVSNSEHHSDQCTCPECQPFTKQEIEDLLMRDCPAGISYCIMETIEASYGPQGVSVVENKK